MVLFVRQSGPLSRPDPSARVIPAADHQIWLEAGALIDAARAEAEAIREQARQAYQAEKERGYQDGLEEARLEAAEQMIENVSRTIDYFGKVEERMVDLVVQAMRRIVAEYDDRDRVVMVVKGALGAVRNQKQVTLRVAPDRLDMVKQATNEILAAYPGIGYLDLVGDARLKGDGCILETEIGIVEASLDGQVEALRRAFSKILGSRK
ncbi:HrpE/YscL family type III secretion apparatus protein [Pseudothauera rhizosphaerae]|uniref:Type 3 secretion system stator protein n=1 Tax=Pseudothauera rhizosphaerae TaxID=2565932 RepID=A0A4V3W9Z2_9RHOO|nr:HrpE/YscL family type III secretion apparatus protein [Pseudothauera rhizosphaerae]THF57269.1 HrpE/YscL family type III secretion apparatus protein [Pseudothauera rhizosphaerae]